MDIIRKVSLKTPQWGGCKRLFGGIELRNLLIISGSNEEKF